MNKGAERKIYKAAGSRSKPAEQYIVKRMPYGNTWGVYDGQVLIEGGFFGRGAAEGCAHQYNKEYKEAMSSFSGTLNR